MVARFRDSVPFGSLYGSIANLVCVCVCVWFTLKLFPNPHAEAQAKAVSWPSRTGS